MSQMFNNNAGRSDSVKQSVVDVALDNDALFVPKEAPLTLPDGTVPQNSDGQAIYRTIYREKNDGSQVLLNPAVSRGYHSDSYKVLYETADAMFPESCVDFKLVGNGEKVMFTQQLEESKDLGGGDEVISYLMYTGSLDSTWATAVYGFAFRPFCTNQIPMGLLQLSQKRTKNHDAMLFSKSLVLAQATSVFNDFTSNATFMRGITLTEQQYRSLRDQILPELSEDATGKAVSFADKRIEAIDYFWQEEKDKVGNNAWALFNAFQSYEFHTATKGKEVKQIDVIRKPERNQTLTNALTERVLATV